MNERSKTIADMSSLLHSNQWTNKTRPMVASPLWKTSTIEAEQEKEQTTSKRKSKANDSGVETITDASTTDSTHESGSSSSETSKQKRKRRRKHRRKSQGSKEPDFVGWARKVHTDAVRLKTQSTQLIRDFDVRAKSFIEFVGNWASKQSESEGVYNEARSELVTVFSEFIQQAQGTIETAGELVKSVDLRLVKFNNMLSNVLDLQEVQGQIIEELRVGQQSMIKLLTARESDTTLVGSSQYYEDHRIKEVEYAPPKRTLLSDDNPPSDDMFANL